MATTSMNISLTDDLKAFIDAEVAKGGYASASDYVRDLVRHREAIVKVRDLVEEGGKSPLGPVVDEAYWQRQRDRVRAHANRGAA